MSTQSEDSNHHPWKRTAWKAREAVSEALVALPDEYPKYQMLGVDEMHQLAQKYLFEYHSVFEPKQDVFTANGDEDEPGIWGETILEDLPIPISGRVRLPPQNSDIIANGASDIRVVSHLHGDLPKTPVDVSLATLEQDWYLNTNISLEVEGWVANQGSTSKTVVVSRYLPVAGIVRARRQLDRCLEEMGWLPQIDSIPRTEITEELIKEVEEWRKLNLGE